jgi:predicted cation transporter
LLIQNAKYKRPCVNKKKVQAINLELNNVIGGNLMNFSETPDMVLSAGLFVIFLVVLLGPFLIKKIEHNLEAFLFSMGIIAITLDTFLLKISPGGGAEIGEEILPRWDLILIHKALVDPIEITLAVLIAGLIFHYGRNKLKNLSDVILQKVPLKIFVFIIIVVLGILSSIITAIIAALLLVEMVSVLKLNRKTEINLVIIACFAIGLGAALTPVGEPLSTIVIKTKLQEDFWFLFNQIGKYIIPGVIALGIVGMFFVGKKEKSKDSLEAAKENETLKDVGIRAFKVYIFVMALVFLGIGFTPIIEWYIKALSPETLYWVNTMSAILDNATLASAEITKGMATLQINAALMGLLIAGGMLIPGNIPNIISAGKLGITSKEWAKLGVPLGAVIMVVYYVVLFVLKL